MPDALSCWSAVTGTGCQCRSTICTGKRRNTDPPCLSACVVWPATGQRPCLWTAPVPTPCKVLATLFFVQPPPDTGIIGILGLMEVTSAREQSLQQASWLRHSHCRWRIGIRYCDLSHVLRGFGMKRLRLSQSHQRLTSCMLFCRAGRQDSFGAPHVLTHQVHQDGQILHVTVQHQGCVYVGALVLEAR